VLGLEGTLKRALETSILAQNLAGLQAGADWVVAAISNA